MVATTSNIEAKSKILTPPTSAQSAEATSPAGEARKMSAEIISWCPYKKKNFALFDEEKLIVSYISLTYYKKIL